MCSADVQQGLMTRAIEVWEPCSNGSELVWSEGFYSDMPDVAAASEGLTFRVGEGLPGKAWQLQTPVVMHNLFEGNFKRSEAAAAAGLCCGIALPFFLEAKLMGVLVFLCDNRVGTRGGVEIWKPNDRRELGLSDSYYAGLDQIARLSPFIRFPRGGGMPGKVWQMRFPKIVGDLSNSPGFIRGNGAQADALQAGVGIPFMRSPWELDSVVLLLSSRQSPFARGMEIWMCGDDDRLTFHSGTYGDHESIVAASEGLELDPGGGVAGRIAESGRPMLFVDGVALEPDRTAYLAGAGLRSAVGLPIYVGATLVAVTILWP
jgi:hypothetical protein